MLDASIGIYEDHLREKEAAYEALCKRCGACCGANEADPCSHLLKDAEGLYFCSTYNDRLGLHKTVSGKEFNCVPLRKILFESWSGSWACAYKRS